MKKIEFAELLDLGAYEQIRERFRARIIEAKKHRRLSVGPHMTFIWENRDTVLFQVQEMLRTERITARAAVDHELTTYNDLVPEAYGLSSTLMIEYDDPAERSVALSRLATVRNEVSLRVGTHTYKGTFYDQPGEEADRLPAVNYVRFKVGDIAAELDDEAVPVEMVVESAFYPQRTALPLAMRRALAADLREPQ
jgi:hypothetical protein